MSAVGPAGEAARRCESVAGREGDSSARDRAALTGLCLALAMGPGAMADTADPDLSGAAPPATEQAPGPEAGDTEEEKGGDGLLSRIAEWLRSDGAKAHPRPTAEAEADATLESVTLGDVRRAIRDMRAEIELLREATGVAEPPREVAPREGLAPVHVHVKTLELLEKTARVQRRLGMIPVETVHAPVSGSAPSDLHRAVATVIGELHRIKRQLIVEAVIEPAPPARIPTPSALYNELARASSLLDALVGRPPTLNDVLVRITRVHREMSAVAAPLGAVLDAEAAPAAPEKAPREVAQQVLRATYKAIGLQTALGMEASGVPAASLTHAEGAEVLDAANILLAEVVRIRMHLGVEVPPAPKPKASHEAPADVFTQALLAVSHLGAMIRAAADAS